MIFLEDEDGAIGFVGGKLPNGGFYFVDGNHGVQLTKKDCARLVKILLAHLAEESGRAETKGNKNDF